MATQVARIITENETGEIAAMFVPRSETDAALQLLLGQGEQVIEIQYGTWFGEPEQLRRAERDTAARKRNEMFGD